MKGPADPTTGSLVLKSPVTFLVVRSRETLYVVQRKSYALCASEHERNGELQTSPSHFPLSVSVVAALPLMQVSSGPHEDGETVISN